MWLWGILWLSFCPHLPWELQPIVGHLFLNQSIIFSVQPLTCIDLLHCIGYWTLGWAREAVSTWNLASRRHWWTYSVATCVICTWNENKNNSWTMAEPSVIGLHSILVSQFCGRELLNKLKVVNNFHGTRHSVWTFKFIESLNTPIQCTDLNFSVNSMLIIVIIVVVVVVEVVVVQEKVLWVI